MIFEMIGVLERGRDNNGTKKWMDEFFILLKGISQNLFRKRINHCVEDFAAKLP